MDYRAQHTYRRQQKHRLYAFTVFLTLLSASLPLMPSGLADPPNLTLMYLSGGMFWVGCVGVIAIAVRMARVLRDVSKGMHTTIGLWHFFQNPAACVFDILLFIGLSGFLFTRLWAEATLWPFLFLSLFIFSFGMHCMLNGSHYTYIYNKGE